MDYDSLRLAWIDIETTGLTPGAIIEVACIITDRRMGEIARFITPVRCEQSHLDSMVPAVREMHETNGLLDRLADAPSAKEVEDEWAEMLQRVHEGDPKRIIMVGNSIGSLDMPFIRACMPKVAKEMHYRSIDITGLRMALGVWSGEDWEFKKNKTHRAEDDIKECQREMNFLLNRMITWVEDGLEEIYEATEDRTSSEVVEDFDADETDNYVRGSD